MRLNLSQCLLCRGPRQLVIVAMLFVGALGFLQERCVAQAGPREPNVEAAPVAEGQPVAEASETVRTVYRDRDNSFVGWMIRSSGIFGFLLMIVLFVLIALLMSLAMQLRRDNYLPGGLVEQFEERLAARDYQGAYETARQSDSLIGRILTAGLNGFARDATKTELALREAESAMQEVGDDEALTMEQKIGYLALIASIAPMLGLLGTVQGMVVSFQHLAATNSPLNASGLIDGMATALFTTLEGLVVCIPALVFRMIYKNRLARFMLECGHAATKLMKGFQVVGKSGARSIGGGSPMTAPARPEV